MVLSSHSWHSVLHLGPIAQDASRGAVDIPELLMPNYFDVGSLSLIDCTEACVPRRLLHSRSVGLPASKLQKQRAHLNGLC